MVVIVMGGVSFNAGGRPRAQSHRHRRSRRSTRPARPTSARSGGPAEHQRRRGVGAINQRAPGVPRVPKKTIGQHFLSIPRAQRTNAALGQRVALWVVAQSLTTWPTIDRASGSAESQCTPSIIAVTKPMILCWLLRGQGWLLGPQHGISTTGKMYVLPVIEHGGCRLPHSD